MTGEIVPSAMRKINYRRQTPADSAAERRSSVCVICRRRIAAAGAKRTEMRSLPPPAAAGPSQPRARLGEMTPGQRDHIRNDVCRSEAVAFGPAAAIQQRWRAAEYAGVWRNGI